MKKIISFEKKIEFPSMIGEVTSISLDHTLKFIDGNNIEGNFIVSGTYKLTEASRIEEEFNYEIPSEIIIGETLDLETAKIDVDDFYYEIENDYTLICYIDVKVEGVEVIETAEDTQEEDNLNYQGQELHEEKLVVEEIEIPKLDTENRECDGDIKTEEEKQEREEENMPTEENGAVNTLFENINETEETYSTYSVYILREEETINSLITKYKTTKEELESYNDLTNLSMGSKIIIPVHDK